MVPEGMLSSEAPQRITFSRRRPGLHIQCPHSGLGHKDLGKGPGSFSGQHGAHTGFLWIC